MTERTPRKVARPKPEPEAQEEVKAEQPDPEVKEVVKVREKRVHVHPQDLPLEDQMKRLVGDL